MKIVVSLGAQNLELIGPDGAVIRRYAVSTASKGSGEEAGSYQTPRGQHVVRAKIGAGKPCCTVFKARRSTGEIWTQALHEQHPGRDWILSRILWLSGCETGCNRGRNEAGVLVDTMRRYIYIHGTPETEPMGIPASHGCIRMRNREIIELFELVAPGTAVLIGA